MYEHFYRVIKMSFYVTLLFTFKRNIYSIFQTTQMKNNLYVEPILLLLDLPESSLICIV